MKFTILREYVAYGGGPGAPDFKVVHRDVSADFVQGFFENTELDKDFRTKPDNMGCYTQYKIVVSKLKD